MRPTGPRCSGRSRRLRAGLVLGVALALSLPATAASGAPGDWTRWRFDAANTGVNPHETRLGPGNVRGLLVALDAATGRLRWRSYVTRAGGATGTVAVAGGLLYVTGDGILLAKDVGNGVNRWKAFPTRDRGQGRLIGSPSVRGGRVVVVTEEGSVLAYRAAGCASALTCEPLWVRQLGAYSPYDPTPGLGETTVFVGGLGRLSALDAATGRRRWSGLVEFLGEASAVTAPVIANGVVYASANPTGLSRWAVPTAG